MISKEEKHLPNHERSKLATLVNEYRDIFRVRLGCDPAVDVEPMNIELEGSERPVKVRQRTYSPEQLEFMIRKVQELIDAGFNARNNRSKWACAPIIVPKPGK